MVYLTIVKATGISERLAYSTVAQAEKNYERLAKRAHEVWYMQINKFEDDTPLRAFVSRFVFSGHVDQ